MTDVRNFPFKKGFQSGLELSMYAVVDKVMRAFTFRHPVSDAEANRVRQEVTEFAVELLANYKGQLARRTLRVRRRYRRWISG
jgi:hypothetical protein